MADQEIQKLIDTTKAHAHALTVEIPLAEAEFDFLRVEEIRQIEAPNTRLELARLLKKKREIEGTEPADMIDVPVELHVTFEGQAPILDRGLDFLRSKQREIEDPAAA